ncbi:hypothetical protein [Amphibacillus sediminis]|uniref:hypothetical protein n=1 Tax=Amphibacillus sediminis TaxID=360185 RepID=UPI0012EE36DE|nr:hypothetical protein [Amphibacillus sediminis]
MIAFSTYTLRISQFKVTSMAIASVLINHSKKEDSKMIALNMNPKQLIHYQERIDGG